MRGVLLFALFLIAATATATVAANCPEKCGNLSIPYPFGIGEGCFRDGFNISCEKDKNGTYRPYFSNVEIFNISLVPAQMHVYNPISFACYDINGDISSEHSEDFQFNLTHTPYRFSNTRNKFTAIGCRTLAYIISDLSGPIEDYYMSGCLSICQSNHSTRDGEPCNGLGCCQTSIPKGLDYYKVEFSVHFNHSYVSHFSPCSYAFLADAEWYKFNSSDVSLYYFYWRNNRVVPVVLDWAIRDQTCQQAKQNKSAAYACISENSDCIDSTNGPGYTCNCSSGYQGNPYISDGCKDINECDNKMEYHCYGKCRNLIGSFQCSCPSGTHGDHNKPGGCKPKLSLLVMILIAGLCCFTVTAAVYLVYEKAKLIRAKQKCFRQNGGLLLQEQINAYQCVRFKIFSVEEIKRATNNFDEARIKGRGGQGIVYEGTLDDKRRVAIKKAIIIDEKKKKEFAKEMYILSLINHKHVIKILGCCLEVEVPILVYEFIPNGTLYQHIHYRNQSMPLGFRLKIAVDSASALAYLHSDAFPSIVHGDIKSSNILLDDEYIAKVSDFGASLLPYRDIIESGVPGTYGYLDPESLQTGQLTEKSDVYSFAVVILELLTSKKAVHFEGPREKKSLARIFKEKGLADILDNEIKYRITKEQVTEFEELLRKCLREKGEERPTMTKVLACLQRMREFNQNLSEKHSSENIEPVHGESSNHTTYTAEYYSSGHRAIFELDNHLTR